MSTTITSSPDLTTQFSPRRRLASTSRRPIIDYNPRNENISTPALKERGYDRNGWPYAPCGILTRPNGFDFNCQRATFSCRRQCLDSKDPNIIEYANNCTYRINYHGFTRHVSIRKFPCLITEVIRGTYRHQKLKALRSASLRGVGPTGRMPKEPTHLPKMISAYSQNLKSGE